MFGLPEGDQRKRAGAVFVGAPPEQSLAAGQGALSAPAQKWECSSQAEAGRHIGLKCRASEKLWSKYRREGLAGLLDYPYKGSRGRLSGEQLQGLEAELRKDQFQSLEQGCRYVAKAFRVHYTASGLWHVLRRLKANKKTARPSHVHKDEAGENRFKKKALPG